MATYAATGDEFSSDIRNVATKTVVNLVTWQLLFAATQLDAARKNIVCCLHMVDTYSVPGCQSKEPKENIRAKLR